MSVGLHQELSPYLCWLVVGKAIAERCPQLRPTIGDPFVQERELSRPHLHQSYRVTPSSETYPGLAASPSDSLTRRRSVVVTLMHDYNPNSHDPSWVRAATDFEEVLKACLCSASIFRIGQPSPVAASAERKGAHIVQTLTISVQYHTLLPAVE